MRNIPVGTLVEARWSYNFGNGAFCEFHGRMWVVNRYLNGDGTLLYSLDGMKKPGQHTYHGFTEDQLHPIIGGKV